ncbi:MAG: lipid-A-disaccharide synthase N-terminal domain-containing protein, partial [Prolixibacteraceae bacterium]|nr:lipid-A-disaccharide synthase N-terminal domain-containing protein [Prolixibacteraceae bacterium]
KSEKEGEVISPVIYWQLSLLGSICMLTYGILRFDFAIVLGQYIVYFIYIRNMQLKKAWNKIYLPIRILVFIIPFIYLAWLVFGNSHNFSDILGNKDVPFMLMVWGSAGQIIFTFRFVYQWLYSENKKESVLPLGFWLISTLGSLMIFVYSLYRLDPVLFAAHSLGLFIYFRNILLHFGKRSIITRINIPFLNKIFNKVSDKIN